MFTFRLRHWYLANGWYTYKKKLVLCYKALGFVTSSILLDFSQGDPVQHQVRVGRLRVRARVGERPEGIRTGLHLEDLQVIWNVKDPKLI